MLPETVNKPDPALVKSVLPEITPVTTEELFVVLTVKEVRSDTVLCRFTCPEPVFKVKPAETLLLAL